MPVSPFTDTALISSLRTLWNGELPHICAIISPTPRIKDAGGGYKANGAPTERQDIPCLFILKEEGREEVGDSSRQEYDAILELSATEVIAPKDTVRVSAANGGPSATYSVVSLDNHRPNSLRQRVKVKAIPL
jgi:hypothetical protein